MHGGLAANQRLADALKKALSPLAGGGCAICVPFPYLAQVSAVLAGSAISLGAQNISEHDSGAYTGEVSGPMLREFGCVYVIVGHSERRTLFGENDRTVAAKFSAAQRAGLRPIFCVGETLAEYESGDTQSVVARQTDAVLDTTGVAGLRQSVMAYEPVWAVGTGKTATPAQAQAVHEFIRARVAKRDAGVAAELTILYGGSVKPANAKALFAMPDIDGGLIGGASLVADDFVAICRALA